MAKLEDLATPSEVLEMARSGSMKAELIKKFKTSEQELAVMLLASYRRGDMTKEEFNNFFKGVPLSHTEMPDPGVPGQVEIDRPSEIVRSLKSVEQKTEDDKIHDKDGPVGDAPETAMVLQEELPVEESSPGAPPVDVEDKPGSVAETLEAILAKLASIDNRLSGIEKKLGSA